MVGEKFGYEVLVKGKNFGQVGTLSAFGIKIVRIEFANELEHLFVVLVHEVAIGAVAMGRIKRVVAQHVLRFLGNIVARDLINVLVVAERKMNFIEAAIRFVDAIFGLILRNFAVGVGGEEFGENDVRRISAADRERIAHDGPLRLPVKAKNFSEIMQKTGEDKPARITIFANCFGSLQQVLDLGEIGVGAVS